MWVRQNFGLAVACPNSKMSEDIDKHVLRKYEICQKLGKGVSHTPLDPDLERRWPPGPAAHL